MLIQLRCVLALVLMGAYSRCLLADDAIPQLPPTHPSVDEATAIKRLHFTFLCLENQSRDFITSVDVNGKPFASIKAGESWHAFPLPFNDGDNHLTIMLRPLPSDNPAGQFAGLRLILGDAEKPDPHHALMLFLASSKDGYSVIDMDVKFAATQPGAIKVHSHRWLDEAHKNLVYELTGEGDAYSGLSSTHQQAWRADGTALSDATIDHGKLVSSKDYRPDGTLGAEVKGGEGFRRLFYPDGNVQSEDPIHHGLVNGTMKRFYRNGKIAKTTEGADGELDGEYKGFDEHGTVRVSGTYKAGQRDGTWIRYDEKGQEIDRSVFDNGDLKQGDDAFNGPTTRPRS